MKNRLYCKILAVGIIVLLFSISFFTYTTAKPLLESKSEKKIKDNYTLIFCFVESGYVNHENVIINGFNLSYPFSICIGSISLDLINFSQYPDEIRLTIKRFNEGYYFKENITVLMKGFIGRIQPTGHISDGFLNGFALFIQITTI